MQARLWDARSGARNDASRVGPAIKRFESLAAFRQVFANRNLRRLQLAMIGSTLGHWGFSVALVVWAYDTGGPSLVGLATFFRILPAAVAAPFLGALADRYERRLVMVISDVVRAASLTVAAVAIATDLPAGLVVVAVAVAGVAASAFYPSLSALLPSLTNTPEELTAANVTTSAIDGLGMFIGRPSEDCCSWRRARKLSSSGRWRASCGLPRSSAGFGRWQRWRSRLPRVPPSAW